MSRRSKLVIKNAVRAGSVDKIIPHPTKGEGVYMTGTLPEGVAGTLTQKPKSGQGKGNTVTEAMTSRKEALWRKWARGS
jgi:hypothetical protein